MATASRDLMRRVRERMEREGVTQKDLAGRLGITQPHLSKLLREKCSPRAKLGTRFERWVVGPQQPDSSPAEDEVRAAIRAVTRDTPERMHLVVALMQIVRKLGEPGGR